VPIIAKPFDHVGVIELAFPLAPIERHATQDDGIAIFVNYAISFDTKLAVFFNNALLGVA